MLQLCSRQVKNFCNYVMVQLDICRSRYQGHQCDQCGRQYGQYGYEAPSANGQPSFPQQCGQFGSGQPYSGPYGQPAQPVYGQSYPDLGGMPAKYACVACMLALCKMCICYCMQSHACHLSNMQKTAALPVKSCCRLVYDLNSD